MEISLFFYKIVLLLFLPMLPISLSLSTSQKRSQNKELKCVSLNPESFLSPNRICPGVISCPPSIS